MRTVEGQAQRSPLAGLGSVAASATIGALLAIGHRLGTVGAALAAIGNSAMRTSDHFGGVGGLIATGLAVHVAVTFGWTAVFLWLVTQRRWSDVLAAVVVGIGELALSWLVAALTGSGIATVVPLGDRLVLAFVLSFSLVVGIRFAFAPLRNA